VTLFFAVGDLPHFPTFFHFVKNEGWMDFILYWEDVLFSSLIALLISVIFFFGARKRQMIPRGIQNFLEWIVENFRNSLANILGPDEVDKHLPFLATLFVYIFVMNIFGVIPFMKSPSTSLSITIGMALCVFARVQYLNVKNYGGFGYLYHMCGSPQNIGGWILAPLMLPIELITQVSRPVTLALRLTGNVMGEHILVSIFAFLSLLIFSFEGLPLALPIQLPAMLFGLFTSLVQALVFTLLSTVYIMLSLPDKKSH